MTNDIRITRAGDEPGTASFKVEVPVEHVRRAEHDAARAFAQRARLPGFRKGKAPLAVVRRQYQSAIRDQVLREVIGESWRTTVERERLEPIADPHVHDVRFEQDAPLTFELHVEVKPDVRVDRTGGFSLTRRVEPVAEETVAAQLEALRRQRAPWVPVEGRRAERGDLVSITLITLSDGTESDPKQFQVVLGEGQAIPDVETRILALDPGATGEGEVRFPDDFPDADKRGQTRSVRITLHEIKRQDLPELDDAFAREAGDFDGLAALRAAVRADLEREARREADAGVRRQLIEQLTAANHVPAPRPLVDRFLQAAREAYSIPDEQLDQFVAEFRPIAEAQVRRDLVLEHVVAREKLRATEAELDERIADIARRRSSEPADVYNQLQRAGRLRDLEQTITEEKVFAHLLSQSTVIDS